MVELREPEQKTLLGLKKLKGRASVEEVMKESGLSDSAVMRAAITLQDENLVTIAARLETTASLTEEGRTYAKIGLPERRVLQALKKLGKKAPIEKVVENVHLEKNFVPIALGWVQRKKWATFDGKTRTLAVSETAEEGNDERLLSLLDRRGQLKVGDLDNALLDAVQILRSRKLLQVQEKTLRVLELTEKGQTVLEKGLKIAEEVTQLTPELIISGKWRHVRFQKYDVKAEVARTWSGKKHPYMQFLDEAKDKLVNLGFKEMTGTHVETAFFNYDVLYTPQDHPAREAFDVYFLKNPKYGSVEAYRGVLGKVKQTHENGWKTGSTGWKYKYSPREARRLLLRGHTTCLSARTLLSKELEIPGRYFSVARCFRPDILDKTHLTEFNQVEGIVVDENLTLRDLLGILVKFAVEIAGAEKYRLKPDYYPFTEPSVELSAYTKECGWIEFGGSGIFRPEVTMPLGIDVPVIAWGLGIDRLFMLKAGVDDIRYLFAQDLAWIRRKGVV